MILITVIITIVNITILTIAAAASVSAPQPAAGSLRRFTGTTSMGRIHRQRY